MERTTLLIRLKRMRRHLPITLVLLLSFTLNIVGITWGLPHYLDWAIDSIVPFNVLEAAYYRFSHGWHGAAYPPVHHAILATVNAPFMGYLLLSGELRAPSRVFPFGFTDPLSTLTHVILISRTVSVLMGVAIIFLIYRGMSELFDRRSALFSALIVTLYYPLVYYAHNANVDVPYLFWTLLALYMFVRILKQGALKDYVCFALFGTLAICTKDQAYGLFLLAPLPILWMHFAMPTHASLSRASLVSVIVDRRHILAAVTAIITFVLAQNLLFNFSGFIEHVQVIVGAGTSSPHQDELAPLERFKTLQQTVSFLASGYTLPLFGLCVVGSIYCALKYPRDSLPILFLAASYYLLFINFVLFVRMRYVLPIGIIMAFFGGKLLAEIWHREPWKKLTRTVVCLVFAYEALFPIQLDVLFLKDSRYAAEQWMQEHIRAGAIVETFAPYRLLKYYPRFPHWVKIRSSKLEGGTLWEPLALQDVRLPNLYMGKEFPDYIVLSDLWYSRFLKARAEGTKQAQVLRELFQGRMGYTLVATFKTATLLSIHEFSVNPKILIFERVGLDSQR